MKLSIAIVGLPNVGKSTLFKALTAKDILIANYPFATIDPNVGIVQVPDERVDTLATMSKSKKKIPAVVEFYDIAGLVKGANKGEGLGNQFLTHIRECQVIVMVLRAFPNADIIHVEQTVDPVRDMEILNTELILKDLETVEKRLGSLERESKSGDKSALKNLEVLKQIHVVLAAGKLTQEYAGEEIVRALQLLTAKKQLYLINGKESDIPTELSNKIREAKAVSIVMDLSDGNLDIAPLIKKAYEALNLISFFTTGEDETRAWTILRGAKAPEAAGAIHTDFEAKFIRAEVVPYAKFVECGGWSPAKQKGFLRLEGKEYIVADGDIMEIRHG